MNVETRIIACAFDPFEELARFHARAKDRGALASFTGYCRATSGANTVLCLELQHLASFTEREISTLVGAIAAERGLSEALVIHRIGRITPDEAIVLVATCSAHRAAALAGVEAIIDALKVAAPLWKREITTEGSHWIEPTEEDQRRARDGSNP